MIYSNVSLDLKVRKMSFGDLKVVSLGEKGRGRKEILLPSNYDVKFGMNNNLTIGLSKNGKPRINKINKGDDDNMYLIIDTYNGYTRRGDGYITFQDGQGIEVIAEGNGADGDAGRIGSWGVYLIKVPVDEKIKIIKINYSGKENRIDYAIIDGEVVKLVNEDSLDLYFDSIDESKKNYMYLLDTRKLRIDNCCDIISVNDVVEKYPDEFFYDGGSIRHIDSRLIDASTLIAEEFAIKVEEDDDSSSSSILKILEDGSRYHLLNKWEVEMINSKKYLNL